jgi:small subunit ribosomal protein S20
MSNLLFKLNNFYLTVGAFSIRYAYFWSKRPFYLFLLSEMPNTKAATKALRVSDKKRSRNRRFLELFKETVKQFEAVTKTLEPKKKDVEVALSKVYSRIDTLEKKNILHKNNAARKKSSFARSVKALFSK